MAEPRIKIPQKSLEAFELTARIILGQKALADRFFAQLLPHMLPENNNYTKVKNPSFLHPSNTFLCASSLIKLVQTDMLILFFINKDK